MLQCASATAKDDGQALKLLSSIEQSTALPPRNAGSCLTEVDIKRRDWPTTWARSSAVEHTLHTGGVTGSIPVAPTRIPGRIRRLRRRNGRCHWRDGRSKAPRKHTKFQLRHSRRLCGRQQSSLRTIPIAGCGDALRDDARAEQKKRREQLALPKNLDSGGPTPAASSHFRAHTRRRGPARVSGTGSSRRRRRRRRSPFSRPRRGRPAPRRSAALAP